MSEAEEAGQSDEMDWPVNYFNYFTEIEEHFQRARGTGLFLLSPLDWALIENWKNSGIPLEAVLRGIDATFEKWRARKIRRRLVNSVAYCTQAVLEAAKRVTSRTTRNATTSEPPFAVDELLAHLKNASAALRKRPEQPFQEVASSLDTLAADAEYHLQHLEQLEQRLTAMEDKMVAAVRSLESEESLYSIRQTLDLELRPYRGRMTAEQLAMLERRYLDTALLARAELPRLSLFYLR
ncbi:MAG: hypothetical protein JO097_00200 [Acidobacteriaceae bacterium]|nr:hypothetical protein [Acidobacteriaceae bacterium]MBV9295583.1 hypothetical protein [Acidobacteriaceae bacterium]